MQTVVLTSVEPRQGHITGHYRCTLIIKITDFNGPTRTFYDVVGNKTLVTFGGAVAWIDEIKRTAGPVINTDGTTTTTWKVICKVPSYTFEVGSNGLVALNLTMYDKLGQCVVTEPFNFQYVT